MRGSGAGGSSLEIKLLRKLQFQLSVKGYINQLTQDRTVLVKKSINYLLTMKYYNHIIKIQRIFLIYSRDLEIFSCYTRRVVPPLTQTHTHTHTHPHTSFLIIFLNLNINLLVCKNNLLFCLVFSCLFSIHLLYLMYLF